MHFSCTVVLVEEENERKVEEEFRRIMKQHFPFHALIADKRKLQQKSSLAIEIYRTRRAYPRWEAAEGKTAELKL